MGKKNVLWVSLGVGVVVSVFAILVMSSANMSDLGANILSLVGHQDTTPAIQQALQQEKGKEAVRRALRKYGVVMSIRHSVERNAEFLKRIENSPKLQESLLRAKRNGVSVFASTQFDIFSGALWIDISQNDERIAQFLDTGK